MNRKLFGVFVLAVAGIILAQSVAAATAGASSGAKSAASAICKILNNIAWLMTVVAAAVGIVVIIIQGIKWIGSAEDPGARKQAKQGIIHAIIGLIIVVAAVWIVILVMANQCQTQGSWFAL